MSSFEEKCAIAAMQALIGCHEDDRFIAARAWKMAEAMEAARPGPATRPACNHGPGGTLAYGFGGRLVCTSCDAEFPPSKP